MRLTHATLVFLAMSGTAFADPVPEDLVDGLTAAVDDFSDSIGSGDMAAAFDYMPPALIEQLAAPTGLGTEEFLELTRTQIEAAMATVTIDDFVMDVTTADWQMTPDGSTGYALVPTATLMTVEGTGQMKATSQTLAFQGEDEVWYLVRTDEPSQVALLQAAYPAFTGIAFPAGTMEMIE